MNPNCVSKRHMTKTPEPLPEDERHNLGAVVCLFELGRADRLGRQPWHLVRAFPCGRDGGVIRRADADAIGDGEMVYEPWWVWGHEDAIVVPPTAIRAATAWSWNGGVTLTAITHPKHPAYDPHPLWFQRAGVSTIPNAIVADWYSLESLTAAAARVALGLLDPKEVKW